MKIWLKIPVSICESSLRCLVAWKHTYSGRSHACRIGGALLGASSPRACTSTPLTGTTPGTHFRYARLGSDSLGQQLQPSRLVCVRILSARSHELTRLPQDVRLISTSKRFPTCRGGHDFQVHASTCVSVHQGVDPKGSKTLVSTGRHSPIPPHRRPPGLGTGSLPLMLDSGQIRDRSERPHIIPCFFGKKFQDNATVTSTM